VIDQSTRWSDPVGWIVNTVQYLGFEWLFKRFYGTYSAIVVDVQDPELRGRVRIMCPEIGQREEGDVSPDAWSLPCMPGLSVSKTPPQGAQEYGMHGVFFPFELGDRVWVQFEYGKPERPIVVGGWLPKGYSGTELQDEQARFKGMRTRSGHYVRFSDQDDDLHITIAKGDGEGGQSGAMISVMDDGSILMASDNSTHVWINNEEQEVSILTKDGTSTVIGQDKVTMLNASGSSIRIDGGDIQMQAQGDIVLSAAGKIALDGGNVDIGHNPTEPAVLGNKLMKHTALHQHNATSPGTPVTPPLPPPLIPGSELSKSVRIAG